MIKKIIAALMLGCVATVVIMQRDPALAQALRAKLIQEFEAAGICSMQATIGSINIFAPSLELVDVVVAPRQGNAWGWKAKKMRIKFSWLYLLFKRAVNLHLAFDEFNGHSQGSNGTYAIADHIKNFLDSPPTAVPVLVKAIQVRNSFFELTDTELKTAASLRWHSDSKKIDRTFRSNIKLLDGTIICDAHTYISSLHGTLSVDATESSGFPDVVLRMHSTLDLNHCANNTQRCLVSGRWDHDHGSFSLKNEQEALIVELSTIKSGSEGISVQGTVTAPLEYVWRVTQNKEPESPIHGAINVQGHVLLNNGIQQAQGKITLTEPAYGDTSLGKISTVTVEKESDEWNGSCSLVYSNDLTYEGSWQWHEQTKTGAVDFINKHDVKIPLFTHWHIPPRACAVHLDLDQEKKEAAISYDIKAMNTLHDDVVKASGTIALQEDRFSLEGTINTIPFSLKGLLKPTIHVDHIVCNDINGKPLLSIKGFHDKGHRVLQGSIYMQLLKQLAKGTAHYDLQGEGRLDLSIALEDRVTVTMHLDQGTIRLPHTYNFINGFDARIYVDRERQKIDIESMRCTLHRGSITCDGAVAAFDDQGALMFAHAPVLFKHCLINFSTDLFMMISGRMLFSKKEYELPHLKGACIIENAHIKENIFSSAFQKKLFKLAGSSISMQGTDATCDISIKTCAPVYIKTNFLEAHAKVDLHIEKDIRNPEVSGVIDIKSGSMLFPYKPLHIMRGTLYFIPQQPEDPIIELVAKNKIKNYNITMTLSGSVSNPTIMLESAPPLTEEQIIALLLLGSHEESLNILMPALIMQNVTNLIFDKEAPALPHNKYVAAMLKPLKNVHVVPSFTDQSGRGGLRGALEVDINDRWRALIQKNFNLTEDTRFELEYMVSDDISVKGFRDERRDLGGEVEVRLKF